MHERLTMENEGSINFLQGKTTPERKICFSDHMILTALTTTDFIITGSCKNVKVNKNHI